MTVIRKISTLGLATALGISLTLGCATGASANEKVVTAAGEVGAERALEGHGERGAVDDPANGTEIAFLPIILGVIAAGGAYRAMGAEAAQRVYHAGLGNAEYQRIKWQIRVAIMVPLGSVGGPIFMVGFENEFYSLA